jgi:hypothetical protein
MESTGKQTESCIEETSKGIQAREMTKICSGGSGGDGGGTGSGGESKPRQHESARKKLSMRREDTVNGD